MTIPIERRLTIPMGEFIEHTGMSRPKAEELIKNGVVKSVVIGSKRLVYVSSFMEFIERVRQEQINNPKPLGRQREKIAAKETATA
jgi:hypothetical protein